MASYFWVGGAGTLDNVSTTHIASSSGGASGAGPVTASDSITFDSNSGLGATTVSIASGFQCVNFTLTGPNNVSCFFSLLGNITISGALSAQAFSSGTPLMFFSNGVGGQRTLTVATITLLQDVWFMDCKGAGAATWTGTRLGDAGGNSGITMTTPAAQTWSGNTTGSWNVPGNWTSRVPLPQDPVLINALTSGTITANMPWCGGGVDFTGSTGGTIASSVNVTIFGSLTYVSGLTVSWGAITLGGRGSYTITSAGHNASATSLIFQAPTGTYTLQDNLAIGSARTLSVLSASTINANGHNVTAGIITASGASTVSMGAGTWTVQATGTVWSMSGVTLVAGTSTIVISDTSATGKTFGGGGMTYNNLTVTGGGTGAVTITGGNTFNALTLGFPKTVTFTHGTTTTVTTFNATGTAGNLITCQSDSSGNAWTLSCANAVHCDYLSLQDSTASGATPFFAGTHSTNVSGNTNWTFAITGVPWTAAEDKFLQNTYITSLAAAVTTSYGTAALASNLNYPASSVALTGSVSGWPSSGTVDIWSGVNVVQTITYASKTGTTLNGVSGWNGSGTIAASGSYVMAQIQENWTVNDNAPASPQTPFWETWDGRGNASMEIVKVLSLSGTGNKTRTVLRGQQGGGCFTHLSGARVQTTLSLGVGYLGSDNNTSVDLGGGRVAWFGNDPNFATAAGQARTNAPGIRNIIGIQSGGYDLSSPSVTLTFYYPGPDPSGNYQYGVDDFFPNTVNPDGSGQPIGTWINNGIMIDGTLFLTALVTSTLVGETNAGNVGFFVDNPSAAPSSWNIRGPYRMWSEGTPCVGGSLLADPGDGFIYFWSQLQVGGINANSGGYFYGARWVRTAVKAAQLRNPQWWCGPTLGWQSRRSNRVVLGLSTSGVPSYRSRVPPRVRHNASLQAFLTQCSFHKRPDSNWQMSATNSSNLCYATRANLNGQFGALTNIYTIPNYGQGFAYVGFAHPELTWTGQSGNDVAMGFNPGFSNSQTHPEVYYPHFVRLIGV